MSRKIRNNKAKEQLTDLQWRFLIGEPMPDTYDAFLLVHDCDSTNEELWATYGEAIVAEQAKTAPGERGELWWKYSAPKAKIGTYPNAWYDGTFAESRKRLRGVGTPAFECRNVVPTFAFGIPDRWIGLVESDLPIYESQAAYLKRKGLLFAGEERKADFEEDYVPIFWDVGI